MYTRQQENSKVNRQKKSGQLQGSNKASLEPGKKAKTNKKHKKKEVEKAGTMGVRGGNNPQNRKSNSDKLHDMIRFNARKHKKQEFFCLFFFLFQIRPDSRS
jgi:hypothetical protein